MQLCFASFREGGGTLPVGSKSGSGDFLYHSFFFFDLKTFLLLLLLKENGAGK